MEKAVRFVYLPEILRLEVVLLEVVVRIVYGDWANFALSLGHLFAKGGGLQTALSLSWQFLHGTT